MSELTPQELDQIRNSMATAEDSVVIAMIKVVLSGGVDKVHPELLRIIADEINARGISGQLIEGKNIMKTTMPNLRKRIRKVILEARPRKNPRHNLQTHPGIGIAHADPTGVNCDFNSSAYQLLSDQVWKKLGSLHYVGDWSMPDGGDGYRFINQILQCRCKETGMIKMAVYCVDRANSENATRTGYDCYVLDCELIQDNHTLYGSNDISDKDLSSGSREWAKKGEYCTNVQQIVDTLGDAHDLYEELLDSGQI
ncbi:MAG: hypothetical protein CBD74_14785 [Saprospirales bacterium TMED214]|nr:MAG: hypothetical protein CBD74_14785 [Saprospirales bacterium TMED214]